MAPWQDLLEKSRCVLSRRVLDPLAKSVPYLSIIVYSTDDNPNVQNNPRTKTLRALLSNSIHSRSAAKGENYYSIKRIYTALRVDMSLGSEVTCNLARKLVVARNRRS